MPPFRINETRMEALHKIIKEKDKEIASLVQTASTLKS
jgi:hypothetical protein